MRVEPVKVELPSKLVKEFKCEAKKAFPKETLAYILGRINGHNFDVEELWWPDDINNHTSTDEIRLQPYWAAEAQEHAKEHGLQIIGTIHTHPYKYGEVKGPDRAPSENDLDSELACYGLIGICRVVENKNGHLRTSIRLWSPMLDVKIKEI